jgi:hypothetical protein
VLGILWLAREDERARAEQKKREKL